MANQHVMTFSSANFSTDVVQSNIPVLVDFWAEWCGPCKMLAPIVDELAEEKAGKLKVGKVNVDNNQDLAQQYNIRSIPTLLLFKNGQVKAQIVGMAGKKDIESKLAPHLA
jgi:thioredoxin 1